MAVPALHAPNAALLIDFDNVTLGVRSDLTKELRTLLNSDIIKGKVAVQRAYADWRRYPQYIVPLSESSIDLIFAPAFGTNKKNATDIRLAVDAVELVFTRPEIGTFILLSGDSDFSSLVLKLKEYGKYVIGVGIRESASDILIQNCDEYFSYSDLAGLTKESDAPSAQREPWELVVEAVQRMAQQGDVMRSDRLKQVMQQIDPNFDESNAGFNRFSKFVTEAGSRGLIQVIKQENGQYDVAPAKVGAAAAPAKDGRPPRDRGRRGSAAAAAPAPMVQATEAAPTDGKSAEERAGRRRGRGRGRGRGKGEEGAAPSTGAPSAAAPSAPYVAEPSGLTLAESFHLLSRALGELPTPAGHELVRARMAALHGTEDVLLEVPRFFKLLRQANDAEVADVRLLGDDDYEVSPHRNELAMQRRSAPDTTAAPVLDAAGNAAPRPAIRFRGGARAPAATTMPMVGVINLTPVGAVTLEAPVAAAAKPTKPAKAAKPEAKPVVKAAKAAAPAKSAKPAKPTKPAKVAKTAATPAAKPAPKAKAAVKKAAPKKP
jgi:uncharacterized protein (TIGR00288 family)